MNNLLLTFPILIPMLAGVIAFMLPKSHIWQLSTSLLASILLLINAFVLFFTVKDGTIISVTFSNWQAPFGIVFVSDILSASMILVTAILACATSIYAFADIDHRRLQYGFVSFLQFMICGICGAFLTGDIFNLYVWFEVMLITSFALLSLGTDKLQIYATIKYLALNIIATVLLLTAIGMLYGSTGSLNMADLSLKVPDIKNEFLVNIISVFFLVALGIKSAVFPLYFWLPASYHLPPVSVSAIFAGILTKVGVYAMIRVFTLIFTTNTAFTLPILLWIAGFTMIFGVLGAAIQINIRRILSFHIISQIGYMIMGLGLFTTTAITGTVFYIVHHIIVKANLFFISGIIKKNTGSFYLNRIGGLYVTAPVLSFLFLIPAFSLAGFPPLSGFWAKFVLIKAGLDINHWWIVFAALFTGLFTIYSMTKIWAEAFWKNHPMPQLIENEPILNTRAQTLACYIPCIMLALLTIIFGLFPNYFLTIAESSSEQILNPSYYVEAVLNNQINSGQ